MEDVVKVSEKLMEFGIEFRPNFILGMPEETDDDILKTLDFAK